MRADLSGIAATSALFLSLLGVGWDAYWYFRGAEIVIFLPREVVFRCDDYDTDTLHWKGHLGLGAQNLTYINLGQQGYGAVISREEIEIKFPQGTISLVWKAFSNIVEGSSNSKSVAAPTYVEGGGAKTHEIQFRAIEVAVSGANEDRRRNFYPWPDFVTEVFGGKVPEILDIAFRAEIFERSKFIEKEARCAIQVQNQRRKNFICNEKKCVRYAAFTCFTGLNDTSIDATKEPLLPVFIGNGCLDLIRRIVGEDQTITAMR